ncbi:MAG: DNA repair protein RecO [Firmicutes bacterium]|nr:DNA repair protein RecO [Bacillota bacterium]
MSLYRVEAVVLNHRYFGEADKIVTLYSREKGKLKAVARGSRRPRNRLLAGTQPYSHTEFLLFSGKGLDQISQCELKESFYTLREGLEEMTAAAYVAELYDVLIEEGEGNEELFYLLLCVLHLLIGAKDIDLVLRFFELRFLSLLGYRPQLIRCAHCDGHLEKEQLKISSRLGGLLCPHCWGQDEQARPVCPGTVEMLKQLLLISPSRLRVLRAGAKVRREMEAALRAYLEFRLPRELKSQRFLSLLQDGEL